LPIAQADEESKEIAQYKKYQNQGPAYFGDLDEGDPSLLDFEKDTEEIGMGLFLLLLTIRSLTMQYLTAWEEGYRALCKTLGLQPPPADKVPPIPRPNPIPLTALIAHSDGDTGRDKRKAPDSSEEGADDVEMTDGTSGAESKRTKTSRKTADAPASKSQAAPQISPLLSILDPAELAPPKMPTRQEMEGVLLALRKRALLEEYLGSEKKG
jgi:pre-mRNA-splicing factor ISY1